VISEFDFNALALREGDVVQFREDAHPDVIHEGPVNVDDHGCLALGSWVVAPKGRTAQPFPWPCTFRVLERRREPVYVNFDRDPVDGDVARQAEMNTRTTLIRSAGTWWANVGSTDIGTATSEKLELLVDGNTGRPPETELGPPETAKEGHRHE
jgi:hypothetical protein